VLTHWFLNFNDCCSQEDCVGQVLDDRLEISQDALGIKMSQAKYARDLLERFHMIEYKYAPNPFLSGVRIEDGGETPLVDNTLYSRDVTHPPRKLMFFGLFPPFYQGTESLNSYEVLA
jgi:hypothetical protein